MIGATAGVLMWILGALGIFENGDDYAIAFGAFAAVTEVIPYVGPWIGAIPPMVVALASRRRPRSRWRWPSCSSTRSRATS